MTEKHSWFKEWFNSSYYHQLYFKRDDAEASIFINKLLNYLQPPPQARMLDVACGKGRHSIQLVKKGYDVTGIDLSDGSIEDAKQNEGENLHFYTHDMRLPFWINYFDYAFNFFTSFGYFKTVREHDNSIRTIAQSLKPDGVFVIDYLNVHYEEEHLVNKSAFEIAGVNYFIKKWFDENHFFKNIQVEDKPLGKHIEFQERVAKFSLGDFIDMFSYHDMQVQEVFGDYDFGNYHVKDSPRMIIIAKKILRPEILP